jgi:signal peptidase I
MMDKRMKDNELYEERFHFKERNANFLFALTLLLIFTAFILFRVWFTNSFIGVTVSGGSMKQTLQNGDKLLTYRTDKGYKAERGDIIIVDVSGYEECKSVNGGRLIKRLIAIEGDKVKCEAGQMYICYQGTSEYIPLQEDYAYYGVNDNHKNNYSFGEYTVGEGEIFFLGDNRSGYLTSVDSRYEQENGSHLQGLYKEEDIEGVVPEWSIKYKKVLGELFIPDEEK